MGSTTKTFTCKNFTSTDQAPNPDIYPPTSTCKTVITEDLSTIENSAADHLITIHGYVDNPQLRTDIDKVLT